MRNKILIIGLIFINMISCMSGRQKKIPQGNIMDKEMLIEYAIYFLDNDFIEINTIIDRVKKDYPVFLIIDSLPEPDKVVGSQIVVRVIENVEEDFTPPDIDYLKHSSRGLSDDQKNLLQSSGFVVLMDFVCVENELIPTLRNANNLILDLTENKNSIIWDSETRECFTREYWKEHRQIKNGSINISKHITIHFYQNNDYCRAITLGMLKFGLPDFCIENLSCHSNKSIASLINLSAQTLLEHKKVDKKGKLIIDIDLLQNKDIKSDLLSSLEENAEKKSSIDIVQGNWEEGDPENRIIEIKFSKKNPQIEHNKLITKVFGAKDDITLLSHDEKILAASERAKGKIPELHDMFLKGLPLGTHLLIKFPFENLAGEREWMWVEVVKWEKDNVMGLLQNDPQLVTRLKSGQEVSKNINDMFDYILYHPDGTQEGNETGKIISKQYE